MFKKKIIYFAFSFVLLNAYQITNTEVFQKNITPNSIEINLYTKIKGFSLSDITSKIDKLNTIMKPECESRYQVIPKYDKEANFKYYFSNVNFNCKINIPKIEKFNKKLSEINNVSKVAITNQNLIITDKEKNNVLNNLRIQAYQKIEKEKEKIEKALNKTCFITLVNFNTPRFPYPYPIRRSISPMRIMSHKLNQTVPSIKLPIINQNKKIKLKTDYKINCY